MMKDNSPMSTLTPLNKKLYEEVLTAHNISILLLIRSYISEKDAEMISHSIKRRVGFCKLIQFLLQSPDFSFSQFISVISESNYNLGQKILNRFKMNAGYVINGDVEVLLNFISDTGSYLIEPAVGHNSINIHRSCPIGVFLRKMIVFLDKLTFSQTVKVYRLYQQYYLMDKNNQSEESYPESGPRFSSAVGEEGKSHCLNSDKPNCSSMNIDELNELNEMEISVIAQSSFTNPIITLFGISSIPNNDEKFVECLSWSHRQTELFLAEQATFLEFDENSALPPPELHRILNRIILINPDYPETYFVSYLNCLRVKEFNGALENLFQFFDNVNFVDKKKSYRYAALNLAIFNVKFNNKDSAIAALRECIMLSHESSDNICLHFAQAWLRYLNEDKRLELIESTVLKCDELELYQIASLSLQMCAQKLLTLGVDGNLILNLLDKSDAINAQRVLPDLTLRNVAHRAAIWCSYGQFNITFIMSQILLNIDTSYAVYGLKNYNTHDVCICICNIANFLSNVGKYHLAKMILSHAKDRFPHEFSEKWKLCEQILYFEYSLHCCLWNDAYKAACRIAAIDKKESILRLAELSFEKGDRVDAASKADELISLIGDYNKVDNYNPYYLLKAYLINAKAKSDGASFFMLQKSLTYAIRYGYPRFRALIQLEIAKLQLHLGFVTQATRLVENSSVLIFSEYRYDEQAAALALLAKCNVASVRHLNVSDPQRQINIKSAISKLESAKVLYEKLECTSKIKDVVYLQAILANEIDLYEARNKYALEFRKIDTEYGYTYNCTSEFYSSL